MKTVIIIPARYDSTRFPGKPLAMLGDKPVIQWVYEAAKKVPNVDVYVATDDINIATAVTRFGGLFVMTMSSHINGTSRVQEAYRKLKQAGHTYDFIINLQGDEPFIQPENIQSIINVLYENYKNGIGRIVSLYYNRYVPEYCTNPDVVKVKNRDDGSDIAAYFKRILPIGTTDYFKHIGIYGFPIRVFINLRIVDNHEHLEQIDWMRNGFEIEMTSTSNKTIAIDTPKDLQEAKASLKVKKTTQSAPYFTLIAGPCVIENINTTESIAKELYEITQRLNIKLIFKASYVKLNRTNINSFTTIGEDSLKIFEIIRSMFPELTLLTDVHTAAEIPEVSKYVDMLQIPAFLCRQTDLLLTAGRTQKPINIKKGQFLSGKAMKFVVQKIESTGNKQIMLTERGTTFGYEDLVVDFRNIPIMQTNGYPVFVDVTHSLQKPNQPEGITGGDPSMIETIAKCAIAAGADGIFLETHPDPSCALSDGQSMLKLNLVKNLLEKLVSLKKGLI